MHLSLARNLPILFLLTFISIGNTISVYAADDKDFPESVVIEKSPYRADYNDEGDVELLLKPFNERKHRFGGSVSVNYNSWNPLDYNPDFFSETDFEEIYGEAETPLISLFLSARWNTALGGMAGTLGAGYYQNEGDSGSELTVTPLYALFTWTLDTLFGEPYLAPYGTIGIAQMHFTEKLSSQEVGGHDPYFYYEAGVLIQLDWMDPSSDFDSYVEDGIENTFLSIAMSGMTGSPKDEKDFTVPASIVAGLKVQF